MHVIRGLAIPFCIYCIAAIYPIHRLVNTATTVAAGAFIASSMTLGGAVVDAAINSSSVEEFMDNGNWGTVAATAFGGAIGAGFGYLLDRQQYPNPNKSSGSVTSSPCDGTATCFVAGTLIATENGSLPIEQITAGMLVYATDPDTGETALKPVVQTFRNTTTEWVHITVNDETLTCTPEHPFYSPVKGWTSAVDLRVGDILVMLNGEYVVVEQVQHELLESPETTYNFEVEDFHTYYVGDEPVLVHNQCVAKDGDFKAIVNEFNETEAPHAHILRNGKRVAKVGIDGNIIKGDKSQGVTRFVSKYRKLIIDGIKKYYPVKGG